MGTSNHQPLPCPSAMALWVPGPGSTLAQQWVAAGGSPGTRAKQKVTDPCPQGDRAQAYCELEHVLCEGDSRPPCGVVNRLLAEVSQDLTAAQVRGRSQRQRELPALDGVLLADSSGLALPREGLRQSPVPRVTSGSFSGRARQRADGCQQCPGGSGPDTLHLGDGRASGPPEGHGGDVQGVCAHHPEQTVQQLR